MANPGLLDVSRLKLMPPPAGPGLSVATARPGFPWTTVPADIETDIESAAAAAVVVAAPTAVRVQPVVPVRQKEGQCDRVTRPPEGGGGGTSYVPCR